MTWEYIEDMRLILHDVEGCSTCLEWTRHHTEDILCFQPRDSHREARKARDGASRSLQTEEAEILRELDALRLELQKVGEYFGDATHCLGNVVGHPSLRKYAVLARPHHVASWLITPIRSGCIPWPWHL